MTKKLAIIGSSGGNLYSQGGNNPKDLLNEIYIQAKSADIAIAEAIFIAAEASMDNISKDSQASLYTYDGEEFVSTYQDTLENVNKKAKELDEKLAAKIAAGRIDGLVAVSSDPTGVNKASVEAAAAEKLPVAGSGGTSMSNIS